MIVADGRRRAAGGLLLVAPALVALVVSYVAPTIWTVRTSFGRIDAVSGDRQGGAGLDNYREAFEGADQAFGFALSLAVLPLLAFLVIAPLLAYAAHRAGRPARWLVRLGLAAPMACFAPTALAAAWLLGRARHGEDAGELGWVVRLATWSTLFGLVCGLGVTLYLAALRPRDPGRTPWPAMATVGGLGAVAVVAAALQVYAYPALLSGDRALTPVVAEYQAAFVHFAVGPAAAYATLLLGVLALLGLLAAAMVILTELRADVDPVSRWTAEPAGWRATGPGVTVALGTVGVLAVTGFGLWPWLTRLGGGAPPPGVSSASVLVNTWLPPLVSTVVGVGLALLAGLGIGALRPLGRWSELLLLPFAPWLFVGVGPLALAGFDRVRAAGQLNTFTGLIPPTWLAIPALFIFTIFFRGQANRWPSGSPFPVLGRELRELHGLVVPALPLVALVGGATLIARAQDLCWSYLVAADAEHLTGPLLAVRQLAELSANEVSVGLVLPVTLVVVFTVGLGALQVLFLDRLALRVGRPR